MTLSPQVSSVRRWLYSAGSAMALLLSAEGSTLLVNGNTLLFHADFDNANPTTAPGVSTLNSGTRVGSWQLGANGRDFGSVIGNGAGNNAIIVDSGLGDARANNWSTIIRGDFSAINTRSFAPGEILGASWLWQHTRNAGVEADFRRQVRLTLRQGTTDGVIIFMDLEWGGQADVGYRQAASPNEVKVYQSPGGGATPSNTNRTNGSWNPADAMLVELKIDHRNQASLSVDARQDGFDVTDARVEFRNNITSFDNFEISFGGTDGSDGTRGAILDEIVIAHVPVPESSSALLCILGGAGFMLRRRR